MSATTQCVVGIIFLLILLTSNVDGRPKVVEMSVDSSTSSNQPAAETKPMETKHEPVANEEAKHEPVANEEAKHEPVVNEETKHEPVVNEETKHEPVVNEETKHEPVVNEETKHEPVKVAEAIKVVENTEKKEGFIGPDNIKDVKPAEQESTTTSTPVPLNVHDARSRAMAEQLKTMPYQGGDVEAVMHGGHHVHGEEHEKPKKPVGVGNVDLAEFDDGKPKEEEQETGPSTLDTEQMMHAGDGSHGHNPHEGGGHDAKDKAPSANNPEDLLHIRDEEAKEERLKQMSPSVENPEASAHKMDHQVKKVTRDEKDLDTQKVGVSVEKVVHGDEHAHDHSAEGVMEDYVDENGNKKKRKVGKEITYEDIKNLGLSEKDLEGVDLGKLLRRDKAEYAAWKNDNKKKGDKDKGFWDAIDDFRQSYFEMLSKQIRHLSQYDEEDPEWELQGDNDPHPGESVVEHESELWGSTKTKVDRRRGFTVLRHEAEDL